MTHSNTFGFRKRENIPFRVKGNVLFDPKCFISEKLKFGRKWPDA